MDSVAAVSATELEEWFEKAFDGLVRAHRPCRSLHDETLSEIESRCSRSGYDTELALLAKKNGDSPLMYKAEREVKKLRAKHAACTIVIRKAGQTIRDLAKSCGVAATTLCALNHYRRHLVQVRPEGATKAPVLKLDTVLLKGSEVLLPPYVVTIDL